MINEENLNKMYEGILKNQELTTKELNSYGFNSKDLADLIDNGSLERIKRGYYSFLSIDNLFYYGKKLIASKEYDKATACFEKCYELDPNHLGACFQLFLRAVQSRDYSKAFTYFEHFYNSDNEYYNNDSNFYLYLLSMITEIPKQHKEYAKYLQLEDIRIDFNDKRFEDPYSQNKVRISALNQKFTLASKQLNELIKQHGRLSVQDIIVRTLLSQAIEIQNDLKKNIINLVTEKKYNEIISRLEEVQEQHHLSVADECILFLAREIYKVEKTGIIPEKEVVSTNKLFEAINGKNFELALSLSKDYIERNNINPSDNAMFMLLKDITELTKMKTYKSKEQPVVTPPPKKVGPTTIKTTNSQTNSVPMTSNITFATVIGYLMQQDFDNSFRALRGYLNGINKSEYEFLIIDLIKISLIEQDMAFSKPMIALTYVARENFTFDISEYIQNFYETLAQNRFTEARIYLDIISKSNKLGQSCVLTDGLEQILNTTEKMLNYKRNNETLDRVDASIKTVDQEPTIQIPVQEQIVETLVQHPISNTSIYIDDEIGATPEEEIIENDVLPTTPKKVISKPAIIDYDDSEFIKGKLNELYEKGIILLRPMDDSRRKGIHNIVKDIPDVVSFSIGSDSNRQVVLRFKPFLDEYLDYSATAKEGNSAYSKGQYDSCIESYRKLLEFGEPKAWVYAKLGLAYMKKFDKDTAIDYLTIATALAKEEQTDFDFTELIASLKGLIDPEDKKPRVRMTTDDFGNDIENYYGIENIHELAELVVSGMDIDDACITLGLNDEQKVIATLVFARESYAQENYAMGDQYLKKVERTKNKTKFVTSLFEEIRRNKRFYRNRVDENHKPLVLTLKQKNSGRN